MREKFKKIFLVALPVLVVFCSLVYAWYKGNWWQAVGLAVIILAFLYLKFSFLGGFKGRNRLSSEKGGEHGG